MFMDIMSRVLTHNCIQTHLIQFFLDLNGLDKSGWAKIFVDIANIHRLGVLILLFFDDS
jgi:hypothetical protein